MSRTNANSKWPLARVKALARWALRSLNHWAFRGTKSQLGERASRLFLIYTENTREGGLDNVKFALDRRFSGYTLEPKALGRYRGTSEDSVIVHVFTNDRNAVMTAAAEICDLNEQESVLCAELLVASAEFVPGRPRLKLGSDRRSISAFQRIFNA
jgi:hypothetical protein